MEESWENSETKKALEGPVLKWIIEDLPLHEQTKIVAEKWIALNIDNQ